MVSIWVSSVGNTRKCARRCDCETARFSFNSNAGSQQSQALLGPTLLLLRSRTLPLAQMQRKPQRISELWAGWSGKFLCHTMYILRTDQSICVSVFPSQAPP